MKQQAMFSRKKARNYKIHTWTDTDVIALDKAVMDSLPLLDHYVARGYTKNRWWDTVAGVFYIRSGILCSGSACRNKYKSICNNYQQYKDIIIGSTQRASNKPIRNDPEAVVAVKALCDMFGLDYNSMLKKFINKMEINYGHDL